MFSSNQKNIKLINNLLNIRMKSKSGLRFLLWISFGTIIFIATIIFSIAKHERSLRERRERRLLELIQAQDNQQRRLSHIRNLCYHHYGWRPLNDSHLQDMIETMITYLDHLIVDDVNHLIYCFVPKVASTNWKRVLLALNLKPSPTDQSEINPLFIKGNESHVPKAFKTLNQFTNVTEVVQKLRTYFKFMFVRHPYERLLSAFRNKFENTYSDYFRQRFGRKIVRMRENASNESLERGHDVSFQEFLSYITSLNSTDHKRQFNEHWRPVFDLCHPCLLDYDLIGKYETLHSDAQLVLWKARLNHLIQFPKREDTYSYQPSSDLLVNYYSNISKNLIEKVAEVYTQDLELFQYEEQINLNDSIE